MTFSQKTSECFPEVLKWGIGDEGDGLYAWPAPEPDHTRCQGGQITPGVLGGWLCPCSCHSEARKEGKTR